MADRQGVEIDYCPKCRGVWLDRGELDKIIERTSDFAPPPSNTSYTQNDKKYYPDKQDYHDPKYGHRRKKGFLGDIFDF
jgi:Zn-finger nucleic acid-binding protein